MDFNLEKNLENSIINFKDNKVFLKDKVLQTTCLLSVSTAFDNLNLKFSDISPNLIQTKLNNQKIEVLIIGSANALRIDNKLVVEFNNIDIGVEIMNQQSACYSFNVLLSEYRNVALLLF